MRLFADTNITSLTVRDLRAAGHDVAYSAEWPKDPGDAALLAHARSESRIFITKDRDIGALVYRDGALHAGVLLIDELGDPEAEAKLVVSALSRFGADLTAGGFVRLDSGGARVSTT